MRANSVEAAECPRAFTAPGRRKCGQVHGPGTPVCPQTGTFLGRLAGTSLILKRRCQAASWNSPRSAWSQDFPLGEYHVLVPPPTRRVKPKISEITRPGARSRLAVIGRGRAVLLESLPSHGGHLDGNPAFVMRTWSLVARVD